MILSKIQNAIQRDLDKRDEAHLKMMLELDELSRSFVQHNFHAKSKFSHLDYYGSFEQYAKKFALVRETREDYDSDDCSDYDSDYYEIDYATDYSVSYD